MVGRLLTSPGRLLHTLRRRAARQTLKGRAPRSILVVCHGNICRSPFAAELLRRELGGRGIRLESAGFVGADRPPPPEALAAAARRGIDLSGHRSRPLVGPLVAAADLVVVMDAAQRRAVCDRFGCPPGAVIVLGDFDPERIAKRGIPDPVNQPAEVFDECYARIERCARALARALAVAPDRPA
jgi:protein-tyrosine phosphatase